MVRLHPLPLIVSVRRWNIFYNFGLDKKKMGFLKKTRDNWELLEKKDRRFFSWFFRETDLKTTLKLKYTFVISIPFQFRKGIFFLSNWIELSFFTRQAQILRLFLLERHLPMLCSKVHFLGQILDYTGQILNNMASKNSFFLLERRRFICVDILYNFSFIDYKHNVCKKYF